jgi:nucleoside-diphosphate-sugar epimerase
MRVLVTGAGGFIGQHVLQRFDAAGWQVHGTSRHAAPAGCTGHRLDLLDDAARRALLGEVAPTHLVHLAWTTEPGRYWTDPRNHDWAVASLALLREFASHGGQHAFMAGSCAEYAWGGEVLRAGRTPLCPTTLYGTCKARAGEAALQAAAASAIACTWGRIFFPYGPGERTGRLLPSLIAPLLSGEPAATGPADRLRDLVYVEDLAEMIVLSAREKHHGAVDLCSGRATSIGEVAAAVAAETGGSELLRVGALPPRDGEPRRIVGSLDSLRALGWHGGVDLQHGIRRSVQWWRDRQVATA